MHVHLNDNPTRLLDCSTDQTAVLVSFLTIQEFSGMDQAQTAVWLNSLGAVPHRCSDGVDYLPAHRIVQFLSSDENGPNMMSVANAATVVAAKLAPYLHRHTKGNMTEQQVAQALRKLINQQCVLNSPCGVAIPLDGLFQFNTAPVGGPGNSTRQHAA